jgi:hypothetical protein
LGSINKLKLAYKEGGAKALSKAMEDLSADPVQMTRALYAFFPTETREAIRD